MAKRDKNSIYGAPVGGGMGDINEYAYRYPQVRNPMPQRPPDTVWEQPREAPIPPEFCWIRGFVEEMKCQMNGMLREILRTTLIPAAPPPYMVPNFYSQPQLRHNHLVDVLNADGFVPVVTFRVPTNNRVVLTALGLDSESQASLDNLIWRFRAGGRTVPFIVDEAYAGVHPDGEFTCRIGTIDTPLSFRDLGLAPHFDGGGNTTFVLEVSNTDAVNPHDAEAIVGAYVYPLPQSSQEQGGDIKAT